ncbi:zinc-binding dehydrogenase [Coniochaeta ligniaria NRRL 30616]|uniref:Zinc-binding dehydrogenase n=1 Tax=Coniochaeta ligniaria NRRL 30616 TaxID=1408157 RepID=A0A1J7J702_9PEZI|nr:zinc-binding dehydrogenase [Coniochaeta ligniaria NRRL 30616]
MSTALAPTIPPTHPAVVTTAPRAPLATLTVPTVPPGPGQVLIHVLWTSSTPLDLHQADGGLLITHPALMGSSYGGVVAQLGPEQPRDHLRVGDKVFGFTFRGDEEKCHQTYMTTDWYMVSKLPEGVRMEEAVAVSVNLVTAFHTLTADFGLELPWPVPAGENRERDTPIVVWGAASSVGNYAVQVLRHWGFENVVAVARAKHHEYLKELGAKVCFDYTDGDVVEKVLRYVGEGKEGKPRVPYVLDCIGSLEGTLKKIAELAERGTKVAIMLPVIVKHATEKEAPVYEMDVNKVLPGAWKEGVELKGTRTHFYLQNEFFKDHLQSEIVPALLEQGVIKPNKLKIVEGKTMLERAENARQLLRSQAVSGEKLVWRVADE